MLRTTLVGALVLAASVPTATLGAERQPAPFVVAQAAPKEAPRQVKDARTVSVRGTVEAIDPEKKTVTLKGPKRSLTVQVRDPAKLAAIKVGDPVVAKYYESLVIRAKKPGEATPGVTSQSAVASSRPGETPAGAVGQEITATVTVVAVDKKANTVTIKTADGRMETVKARDPKNLEKLNVDDLIELTYTQALAISLDKQK